MTKYLNKKCEYQGIKFDSIKERNHYIYLKQLEEKGTIKDLKLQVKFPVVVNKKRVCSYVSDFTYYDEFGYHVVDVKSPITAKNPVFRLKKKLVEALYNFDNFVRFFKIVRILWEFLNFWFYFFVRFFLTKIFNYFF